MPSGGSASRSSARCGPRRGAAAATIAGCSTGCSLLRAALRVWIARTGSARRDLPEGFGKWSSVYRQFRRWTLAGLWGAVLEALNEGAARLEGVAPDRLQMVDSTIVRAHQHAAGAPKKGAGALRAKVLAARVVASYGFRLIRSGRRELATSGSQPGP